MKSPTTTTALVIAALTALHTRPASAQATVCRDAIAISENARMGGYNAAELRQHMTTACKPGELLRLNSQDASIFCDFGKQIMQEGRGIVVCVMAGSPAKQR